MRKFSFILVFLLFFVMPQQIFAHATLIESIPKQNSVNQNPPNAIILNFNERLENGLYHIRVYDHTGMSVTNNDARMSKDQQQLNLELPTLREGSYTVSYRVISADGHPISASYVFHIGDESVASGQSESMQHEHQGTRFGIYDIALYTLKAWYYLSMILLAGMLLWMAGKPASISTSNLSSQWLLHLKLSFLLSLLIWIGLQLPGLIEVWSINEFVSLLNTSLGRLWAIHLAAALLGFVMLRRNRYIDISYALILLAAKATSGHSAATEFIWASMSLDMIHLLAAALWSGGLLIIIANWKRQRTQALTFLPTFSQFAWISIVGLSLTGVLITFFLIPSLDYLLYSAWGIALLIKTALVFIVIIVAALIRNQWKRRETGPEGWALTADFSLAAIIIAVAAVLSSLNPAPANEPMQWHEMSQDIHMIAEITPNSPGKNQFVVKVWLPENTGEPKRTQLQLVPLKAGEEPAPIDIPLALADSTTETVTFPCFDRYIYTAEGIYMTFPGEWKVVARILTSEDKEYVYDKKMRVY